MKLNITGYNKSADYHLCIDEEGTNHRVDFMVDGKFVCPEGVDYLEFLNSFVGKEIEVDYVHPFIEIASNPRIINSNTPELLTTN